MKSYSVSILALYANNVLTIAQTDDIINMGAGEAQTPAPEGCACCRCTTRPPAPTFNGGADMDVTVVTQLITTVGFPIACTFVLFAYLNKEREEHAAETKELKEAINNNTIVMQKLIDKLEGGLS